MEMGKIIAAGFRAYQCSDCSAPISPYSRGRCRPCSYIGLKRPAPADFMVILHKLGSLGCARHYHASAATVTRWRREGNLPLHHRAKLPATIRTCARGFSERPLIVAKEWTLPGQAADFLRHVSSIHRCDAHGRAAGKKIKGTHWNRNGFVLTDDELISRAIRLGWVVPEY